jgi:hypothetical protein
MKVRRLVVFGLLVALLVALVLPAVFGAGRVAGGDSMALECQSGYACGGSPATGWRGSGSLIALITPTLAVGSSVPVSPDLES